VVFFCRVENVHEFDAPAYPTEREQIMFTKQYLVSNTATAWNQYYTQCPEGDHTWAVKKNLLYSRVAPTKHHTDAAFQMLHSAKQGPDKAITSFGTYIINTCEVTEINNSNKRMFFWTGLHPEILAAIRMGEYYLTFDACLKAGVKTEIDLRLDAEVSKAFKSASKGQAANKARRDKGKGKTHHNFGKGRS
jgi:hypothetical protein